MSSNLFDKKSSNYINNGKIIIYKPISETKILNNNYHNTHYDTSLSTVFEY